MFVNKLLAFLSTTFGKVISAITSFTIIASIASVFLFSKENMVILYSELSKDDVNAISNKLSVDHVKYQVSADGKSILVPESLVYQLRASMASEGLPLGNSAIVGYEIFDREEQLGSTAFSQNVKNVRARQGELSRTIQAFESVAKARVHLAIPHRELFSYERQTPTASIMLTLRPGFTLRSSEIRAISHLVAHSVEGLREKDITIADTAGNLLQAGGEGSAIGNSEHCSAFERHLKEKIEALVSKIVGAENVEVRVNVEMSFDKLTVNSETYDPDRSVIRSSQSKEEIEINPFSSSGGEVSVTSNLPDYQSSEDGESLSKAERREDTINYEVSRTIQNKVSEVGHVSQISVSVLVNDHFDAKTGNFAPRSESDMAKIEALVKGAMGYQDSRDDRLVVTHMPFFSLDASSQSEEKVKSSWIKVNALSLIRIACTSVISSLFLFYGLLPLLSRLRQPVRATVYSEAKVSSESSSGDLEKLLEGDRAKFVDVVRKWMRKE